MLDVYPVLRSRLPTRANDWDYAADGHDNPSPSHDLQATPWAWLTLEQWIDYVLQRKINAAADNAAFQREMERWVVADAGQELLGLMTRDLGAEWTARRGFPREAPRHAPAVPRSASRAPRVARRLEPCAGLGSD